MMEPSYIIQRNIERYRGLLKNDGVSKEQRPTVVRLLADTNAQLPLALAEELARSSMVE